MKIIESERPGRVREGSAFACYQVLNRHGHADVFIGKKEAEAYRAKMAQEARNYGPWRIEPIPVAAPGLVTFDTLRSMYLDVHPDKKRSLGSYEIHRPHSRTVYGFAAEGADKAACQRAFDEKRAEAEAREKSYWSSPHQHST